MTKRRSLITTRTPFRVSEAARIPREMEHQAFTGVGSEPGVEIWTIDNFEPVSVENKQYGQFYNADSYIVLKTTGTSNSTLSYDAHFWLGAKTTQDKKGTAAIMTVTLDDMLGGKAVHHREVQGHESAKFLGYFKPAIRYLEGGLESGFNEVTTNAGAEKRLLRLTGCDNMRIDEVPAEASSLTKEDCFILEVEHDIFVLMPEGARATHRRKVISYANKLRDDYHNGRATIEIIDEFSSDDDVALFFEALGSGSKEEIAAFSDDKETYVRDSTAVYLYKVLLGDDIDLVTLNKPYKQKHLASEEMYVLDTPTSGIYIWIGKDVDAETKKNYSDVAQKYLELKGYPSWVHVTRVAESSESSTFKQYFQNWDSLSSARTKAQVSETDAGYYSGDTDEIANSAKLIGKSATARGFMPDQGEGEFAVYRVDSGELEDITDEFQSGTAVVYQGHVYIIQYKYQDNGADSYILYYWMGSNAESADKSAVTELVTKLEEELEGNTTVIKVPQGKESKHFLTIFKGNLLVLFGGKSQEFAATNAKGCSGDKVTRLFRVEGTELGLDMRAIQLKEEADSLEDDDVFVLETSDSVYIWHGKESDSKEQEAALEFVKLVDRDGREIITIDQGEESDEFWEALGGSVEEKEDNSGWRNTISRRVNADYMLTAANVDLRGNVTFEEMADDFTQEDLSDDGVYILDLGEEIYMWVGKNVPERVKMAKNAIVEEYLADDDMDRTADSAVVVKIKQGNEPKVFQKLFPSWDPDMWDNQTSYEDLKTEAKATNSK